MILLCGIPSEAPLALAIEAAERLGVDFRVFNQREAGFGAFELVNEGESWSASLELRGERVDLSALRGCYVRTMDVGQLPEQRALGRRAWLSEPARRSRAIHLALEQWVEVAHCRIANRPSAMASNGSKPFQAQLIRKSGLSIPATLITNSEDELSAFVELHSRVIYKSVSGVRSIVKEVTLDDAPRLSRLRHLPTQFQAFIPGDNVRVHVTGSKVFPTLIRSDAVDYRYASRDGLEVEMKPYRIPDAIAERCVLASRLLDLPLCGIDLKRKPNGDYVCFEVNPSPAFSYYQEQTGQPIAAGLIDYLQRGDDGAVVQVLE
jgi:glutathione synthase/RimK-type ligase-like ATP-grasp enzyme